MKHELSQKQIVGNQKISSMCLVCGKDNPLSLHAQFYDLEGGELCAEFTTSDEHQSYPGRVHGGVISAILDEVIGRVIQTKYGDEVFGVTMELTVKYRKPVPLGQTLRCVGRLDSRKGKVFSGSGEILLADGTVCASATGKYMELDCDNICEGGLTEDNWLEDTRPHPAQISA
ncbi:MAG: PaaI family thioesterase [Coriobacteriales bacterium]|jgi:uncharacterized protein (TIGR00369 family)|nr:PaaI family thioesterase [Coriobacteriales bacterium]